MKTMKTKLTRLLSTASLAFAVMLGANINQAAAATGTLSLESFTVPAGGTVTVPLAIDVTGGDIGGFEVTLTYDKSVVNIASNNAVTSIPVTSGGFDGIVTANAAASANTSVIAGINATPTLTGHILLADITFTGTGAPGTSTTITVTPTGSGFIESTGAAFSPLPVEATATASITPASADTTPDAFTFTDQNNVALSTLTTSNTITVSGINAAAPISITGGEYSINGGAFATAAGTVSEGNTVTVRQTSSASPLTTTSAVLTIDGISDSFDITTTSGATTISLNPIPNQTAKVGELITFTATAINPNAGALTFSLGTGAPSGATIGATSGVFSWTPATAGTFTFPISVTDGTSTDTKDVTITVTAEEVIIPPITPPTIPPITIIKTENDDDGCSLVCKKYKFFKQKYKKEEFKKNYFIVKGIRETNMQLFVELKSFYLANKFKDESFIATFPRKKQEQFWLFRSYDKYKLYLDYKDKIKND
jgi:hypothetical protein